MDVCQGITRTGKPCKNPTSTGWCRLHCSKISSKPQGNSSKITPSPKTKRRSRGTPKSATPRSVTERKKVRARVSPQTPPSPPRSPMEIGTPRSSPLELEKEWRLGRESPGMGSLGWDEKEQLRYMSPEIRARHQAGGKQYQGGNMEIPFPPEYQIVYDKLKDICKSIRHKIDCDYHPTMPGVVWMNTNRHATTKIWRLEMMKKGNHFAYDSRFTNDNDYPPYDRCECKCCNEKSKIPDKAVGTLLLSLDGDDKEWENLHGACLKDEKQQKRKVSQQLREKIMKDAFDYLAEEYKIHLQPKPEYQLPVLRVLAKLLVSDKEFGSRVESWKAVIPYHRVKTELNLPVIVIYPFPGKDNAEYVLKRIIKAFDKYDAKEIGLNHTPRFNKKFNEFIYYAGGSGDHKDALPNYYFTTPEKIFYKGHELHV